ncbi:carbohydrate ABC transporter permease [Paenibacillus cellulositrophicus]|uniref:carbohydrate ABC transporter permease n=1 Tax=Paenibacillus cellulositrophicus TaxID=562959 RepID=UPI003F7FE704
MSRKYSFHPMTMLNYLLLTAFGMITLFPFLHVLAQSLSSQTAVVSNQVTIFPVGFHFEAYRLLLKDDDFYRAFGVSVLRTAAGVAINMTLTSLMAYPLSRVHLKGRNLVMNMVIFTLLFQGGLIPSFLLLRELHLLDSIWSLLLPSAVSPFNLILLKNFFQSVPHSLEESAKIDGAGHGTILFRIMIPLSMPAIATLSLFYAVMHWNTYFDAVMYISNPAWNPLQVYLRNMIVLSESNIDMTNNTGLFLIAPDTLKAATIVASVLPMIIVYPFVQRFFTKGVMLGALKE